MASDRHFRWFESDFRCFCEVITGKIIVEELESIMGAHAEQSSPLCVCIPQKSLTVARDFWNTNSLGWTPFHMGAHDGFSIPCMRNSTTSNNTTVPSCFIPTITDPTQIHNKHNKQGHIVKQTAANTFYSDPHICLLTVRTLQENIRKNVQW